MICRVVREAGVKRPAPLRDQVVKLIGRVRCDCRNIVAVILDENQVGHPLLHFASAATGSTSASCSTPRTWGTVRLNRGAGAGCVTPSRTMKTRRAWLCGCLGASDIERTGVE